MQKVEQAIRERAYQLWVEGGHQDGHADAHWLAAQREILSASLGDLGDTAAMAAKPKKASVRKKKRAA
jgi:Protein of unknown function (DUF2934)